VKITRVFIPVMLALSVILSGCESETRNKVEEAHASTLKASNDIAARNANLPNDVATLKQYLADDQAFVASMVNEARAIHAALCGSDAAAATDKLINGK